MFPELCDTTEITHGLLARLRAGDRDAADRLFSLHQERLWRAVRAGFPADLRPRLDEGDVLQQAFVNALRRLDRFDYRGEGSFLRWLVEVTENTLRDELRSHRAARRDVRRHSGLGPETAGVAGGDGDRPSQHAIRTERIERLERALDRLRPEDRELLVSHYLLGMTLDEIADHRGCKRDTARVAVHRAKARLMVVFEPEEP